MNAEAMTQVIRQDATALGPNRGEPCTLVFLDPPYGKGLGERALVSALSGGWTVPGAMVVWEDSTPPLPPAGFAPLDQRRYGETLITLLRAPE